MLDTPTPAPGARVLASIRMRLPKTVPSSIDRRLAVAMEAAGVTADDLTDAQLAELGAKAQELIRSEADAETIATELSALLKSMVAGDEQTAVTGSEATAIAQLVAMHGGGADRVADFLSRGATLRDVTDHYRAKGPSVTRHRGGAGRAEMSAPRVAPHEVAADAIAALLTTRHRPTHGAHLVRMGLDGILAAAHGRRGLSSVSMASHTRSDFPLATGSALEIALARELPIMQPEILAASHELPADDYRSRTGVSLSASAAPGLVGEGGEVRHVTIDERGELLPVLDDYAAMFRITRKAEIDGAAMLGGILKAMLQGSVTRAREVVCGPLIAGSGLGHTMSDGLPVFHASHGNIAGTGATLDETTLTAAHLALRSQKGPKGEVFDIRPWALVVPPPLEITAKKLVATITPTATDDVNVFEGLRVIVEPGLASATAWYLIGDPSRYDGLAHSFLSGARAPAVESQPGWNTLTTDYRLTWAVAARFVEFRSWYLNPGA